MSDEYWKRRREMSREMVRGAIEGAVVARCLEVVRNLITAIEFNDNPESEGISRHDPAVEAARQLIAERRREIVNANIRRTLER